MTPIGRGLASLIPKRDREQAKEMLDRIDSMEFVEDEATFATDTEEPEVKDERKLSIIEEFETLEEEPDLVMPSKPMTSPLPMDEDEEVVVAKEEETPTITVTRTTMKVNRIVPIQEEDEAIEIVSQAADEEPVVEEKEEETIPEEPLLAPEPAEEKPEVVDEPAEDEEKEEFSPSFGDGQNALSDMHEKEVIQIPVEDIHINPFQPRRLFDPQELEELQRSIELHGILQPLVVNRTEEGYELIAGERRLRASKNLGWAKVPCVVRKDVKSNQSRLVFALIENIQRQNLNAVEEAMAYEQLNKEFGLTHEEIGQRVGRSRVGITNIVRILQLPQEIQRGLSEGKISMGHARAILMIPDEEKQIRFYQHLLDEGLTVRKAETRARRVQRSMKINDPMRRKTQGRHILALKYSPKLEARFGSDAYVKFVEDRNRFEVTFRAYSEKEAEELIGRLLGEGKLNTDTDKDVMESEEDENEEE